MEKETKNRIIERFQQHTLTVNRFIDYLKRESYPEESIVTDWGTHKKIDIAVLEPESKIPIAIYEVKSVENEDSLQLAILQLKEYTLTLNIKVKCSVVLPSKNNNGFNVYDVTDAVNENKVIHLKDLEPENEQARFLHAAQGAKAEQEMLSKENKKIIITDLKVFCWKFIPVTSLVLIILDRFMILPFTVERLIIYAGTIAIMLLPFVNEIKMGDNTLILKSSDHDEEIRFMDSLTALIDGIKSKFNRNKNK